MSFRDSFLVYSVVRPMVLFGVRINPVLRALDAGENESVLDAGCGFGALVKHFTHCHYTGIDSDPARIKWAREKFGENSNRKFVVGDVCRTGLPSKSFDKVIGLGILHHMPDDVATACVRELSRVCRKRGVFADPVYSKHHWISNFLCDHDRGDYVRDAESYLKLCRPVVESIDHRYYHAYSGVAKYFLMACQPRPEAIISSVT